MQPNLFISFLSFFFYYFFILLFFNDEGVREYRESRIPSNGITKKKKLYRSEKKKRIRTEEEFEMSSYSDPSVYAMHRRHRDSM